MIYQYICSYQPITLLFIRKIELLHCSLDLDYTGTCNKQYIGGGGFHDDLYSIFYITEKHPKITHVLCPLMLKELRVLHTSSFLKLATQKYPLLPCTFKEARLMVRST